MTERHRRATLVGVVVSDKMNKTVAVEVRRLARDARFGKYMRRRKKYFAHDENNMAKVGDTVIIRETRPLSRLKRWTLVKVLRHGVTPIAETQAAMEGEVRS
jgi:small subunit ribosomal protein S17